MKRNFWLRGLPLTVIIFGLVITTTAWQDHSATNKSSADTIPKKHKKIKDIDDAIIEMDKATIEVEKELRAIDWEKIGREIRESIKNIDIDMEKARIEMDKAMKEIDVVKIKADIEKAMKEIDVVKLKAEIDKAMKEIDPVKIKAEIEASLSKVDMEKIKAEMEKIKEVDMKKIAEEMKNIKPEIEKSITDAKESIEKAKAELKEYKSFIDNLDEDGLINKKENYTIKHEDGTLTINGKKQSAEVYNKYKAFLQKHKEFNIKKDEEDFDIDMD